MILSESKPASSKKKIMIISNTKWSMFNFRSNLFNPILEKYCLSLGFFQEDSTIKFNPLIKSKFFDTTPSSFSVVKDAYVAFKIYSHLNELKYAKVLVFTTKALLICSIPLILSKTPFVYTITGFGRYSKNGEPSRFAAFFYRFVLKRAEKIICQNKPSYIWCKRYFSYNKIIIVKGSGVLEPLDDECNFEFNPNVRLVYGGRYSVEKGIVDLIRKLMCSNMIDLKLYSVELHIYPARLEDHKSFLRLLKKYHNYSNIQIILHNPSKIFIYDLKEYHALLLPSEYGEGTPKSLLEALSIGLPVFVTQSLYSLMWDDIQQSLHVVDFKSDALISAIINVLRRERLVTHKIDLGKKVVLECCSEEIIAKKYLDIL